jgi:hypothetical protein
VGRDWAARLQGPRAHDAGHHGGGGPGVPTSTDTTTATGDKTVAAVLKAKAMVRTVLGPRQLTLTDAAGTTKAYRRTVHIRR